MIDIFEALCWFVDSGPGRAILGAALLITALRRIRLMDETTHRSVAYTTAAVATTSIGYAVLPLMAPSWLSCVSYLLALSFLSNWWATAYFWSKGVPSQFRSRP